MVLAPAPLSTAATAPVVVMMAAEVAARRMRRNSSECSHDSFAVANELGHSGPTPPVAGLSCAVAAETSVSPVLGGVGGLLLVDGSGSDFPCRARGRMVGLEACDVLGIGIGIAMGAGAAAAAAAAVGRGMGTARPVTLLPHAMPCALNVDWRFV